MPEERPDVPRELKRRRRGRRAGVERRARRRRYLARPPPSIIMGNVRSLPNKMDDRVSGADPASAGVSGVQPPAVH
ncbi:hypothetical protein L3Q82_006810 [Scortum barcoo]|uniref:Uncharacterized protein n=1 Tax=Scortum barcoo TaxID=214431 RepID=A0ACB8WW97_9TELE|nr:hypothetical protein L3Q82_006810 [Scortum barcoo]